MFAANFCGPGRCFPVLCKQNKLSSSHFWILVFLLLLPLLGISAEKNKDYHIETLCKNHFSQMMYKKIDGAVVMSKNERNLNCVVTFQTHSILQRFMLRFDMLQLDCNDHLFIYDGANAVGQQKYNVSCRNTKQLVGSLFTHTNFVTLKYVTDNWGTDNNGFKLVITAIKDPKHVCQTFLCASRELCIHPDLVCDEINHCGDNSDENHCQNNKATTLLGLELTWLVLVSVTFFLAIGGVLAGLLMCVCRHNSNSSENQIQSIDMNGSTKYMHKLHSHKTASLSGNWHHPANKHGYIQQILSTVTEHQMHIWHLTIY
ncbi:uncharacterized protein LOC116342025 [Contarinia nasturtii]|uniref:uncharacterized protein LOC116342025 n=1 Tax=Contarinia nasturtii TaxID=265458 RepID=UPI0012D3BDB0|nr:uncharacterized protein LOC116342025 [Contarinia nasturtii]XP_031625353.1 uncharacterized protein LOC116342025 [Contarinia nasturtii]